MYASRHWGRAAPLAALAVAVVALGSASGCRVAGTAAKSGTQVERLARAYPELRTGRFAVIADFEEPKYMQLFHLLGVSREARRVMDAQKGRADTGSGCLLFTAGSPNDALVVNNEFANQWYLKRDWRPFDLLLMSIHAPADDLALQIAIQGGPPRQQMAAHASIPLTRGWNSIRLDLAEIGERVPLDDVREIRFAVSGSAKPVELRFDDILLTGNREDLLGDSRHREAGLYVQRVGRRWRIGAGRPGADFEITFANGQIVEWFNRAADPHRLRNLVQGTALGPAPVVIGAPDPGKAVAVRSRIVELSPVRVVVASEWRFVDDPQTARAALDDQPFERWLYTIYPTGQVYVAIEATAETTSWSAPQLGLAVTLSATVDEKLQSVIVSPPPAGEPPQAPPYVVARSPASDAVLLYVVDDREGAVRMSESPLPEGGGTAPPLGRSFVALRNGLEGKVERWACHILLSASSEVSDEEARARAIDYVQPAVPKLTVGSFAPAAGASSERPGFDPASGCYRIVPEQGHVRLVLDGSQRPLFSPAFEIANPTRTDAWVYVDHLILNQVARDAEGNLIFQWPGVVRKPMLVEVLFRGR